MTAERTSDQPSTERARTKRMRLRYAGTCAVCSTAVPEREWAIYDRVAKTVTCIPCSTSSSPPSQHATAQVVPEQRPTISSLVPQQEPGAPASGSPAPRSPSPPAPTPPAPVVMPFAGVGGGSARREYERRKDAREKRIREKHPRVGGLILALTDEPQSTRAWATGAKGEEELAAALNNLAGKGVYSLHDRRIPRSKANIDHIAVSSRGVFVIDAKRYRNQRPSLRAEGGLFRPRTETLMIGRRDGSKLVAGVHKQVNLVREALAGFGQDELPVRGMLCFLDADWPLIGGSFSIDGVDVVWPRLAAKILTTEGDLSREVVRALHHHLSARFPPA